MTRLLRQPHQISHKNRDKSQGTAYVPWPTANQNLNSDEGHLWGPPRQISQGWAIQAAE